MQQIRVGQPGMAFAQYFLTKTFNSVGLVTALFTNLSVSLSVSLSLPLTPQPVPGPLLSAWLMCSADPESLTPRWLPSQLILASLISAPDPPPRGGKCLLLHVSKMPAFSKVDYSSLIVISSSTGLRVRCGFASQLSLLLVRNFSLSQVPSFRELQFAQLYNGVNNSDLLSWLCEWGEFAECL